MNMQPHDQDEEQTPSGAAQGSAASATPGDGAEKGRANTRGRPRRRGKGGQSASSSSGASTAKPETRASDKASQGDKADTEAGVSDAADHPSGEATDKADASDDTAKPTTAAAKGDPDKTAGAGDDTAEPASAATKEGTTKTAGATKPGVASGGGSSATARTSSASGNGKGGGKAGLVALVLVILLAIGVGLFGWQAWQRLEAQQARLGEVETRSERAASAEALAELETRLEEGEQERETALDNALSDVRDEFADYRSSVDETLDQVLDELSSEQEADERDWLHAEAAYLLRLANQRLQLERDVEGAAALLRTADQRLQEADNPALVPVRREIASELAALDSVPSVDRTGLYLSLNAQQEQLARQPLAQDIEQIEASSTIEEAPTGGWQHQLARFGQELKDLVTVRQHDQALEALISPEQESYLRQSVRLVLEQAQLALLKEEQELYEASLDKVLTLIEGYYDTEASGVQSVISRVEELKQQSIRPELPDISGSQQALASFIERRFESRSSDEGDAA